MSDNFFEKRIGCPFSDFPIHYAKEMWAPCVGFAYAWFRGRKVVFQPNYRVFVWCLGSFISQVASRKFSALYRHKLKANLKISFQEYTKQYFYELFIPYPEICILLIIPPEGAIYNLVAAAILGLAKPAYVLWHDPAKDGEYADYTPPSRETRLSAHAKIYAAKQVLPPRHDAEVDAWQSFSSMMALQYFPTMTLDDYVDNKISQRHPNLPLEQKITITSPPLEQKIKSMSPDIREAYKHFVEEQTISAWAIDQAGMRLNKVGRQVKNFFKN